MSPNSTTRFNSKNPHIVPHCKHIYEAFNNAKLAKQYHIYSSWFIMLLELIDFMQNNPSKDNEIIEQLFFPMYIEHSIKLLDFNNDPLNLIPKLLTIEPYLKKGFKYRHKLRLTNPKKYNKLKPLFAFYDSIKLVEKGIRIFSKKLLLKFYNSIKNLEKYIRRFLKKKAIKTIYKILKDMALWYIFYIFIIR